MLSLMVFKRWFIYAVCSLSMSLLYAQGNFDYSILTIPDSLTERANTVVQDESYFFKIKSEKEGILEHRKVVTVLNGNSQANVIQISYDDKSKVSKIKVNLYDKFGQFIRKAKPSEIQDISAIQDFSIYEDDRILYLEINHNDYPYTIEYEYSISLKGIKFGNFPRWVIQEYGQSIQKASFSISIPEEQKFYYQTLNIDLKPKRGKEDRNELFKWEVSSLKSIQREPYGPSPYKVLPLILFSPDVFQIDQYRGSMASWNEYGKFMHALFAGKDDLPDFVQEDVRTILSSTSDKKEKIQLLYNYLQEKNRYVSVQLGIGGWEPFDAAYVAKNQYGDCKALTNYMKALLSEAGIDAYPALIKNGPLYYEISEEFTTPSFNHVILYIPETEDWLECTSNDYPVNYIGSGNSDRNVMIIKEEGGEIIRTPKYDFNDNLREKKTTVEISTDGSAKIQVIGKMYGSEHELYRYLANNISIEKQQEWFVRQSKLPSFKLEQLTISASEDSPQSEMEVQLNIYKYGTTMGIRQFIPINLISEGVPALPSIGHRKNPIITSDEYTAIDSINYRLPQGFVVESIPDGITIEKPFGSFELEIKKEKNQIQVIRKLTVMAGEWPAELYMEMKTFFDTISKKDQLKAVIKKTA